MRLIYGFDPLCGWCFGLVPAFTALRAARPGIPVSMVFPGLVTGDRVGPYAEAEAYIRQAGPRMEAVTGRRIGAPFWDLIRTPGVMGDSAPPVAVLAAVREARPDLALAVAHDVTEAHFLQGADLNRAETYAPILAARGYDGPVPDVADRVRAEAAFAEGRASGIRSFPTLILERDGRQVTLPSVYEGHALIAAFDAAAVELGAPA